MVIKRQIILSLNTDKIACVYSHMCIKPTNVHR